MANNKNNTIVILVGVCVCVHSVMSDSFSTPKTVAHQAPCPWNFPGKNTGVGCHFLLRGIFPTQGLNPCLLHWQLDSLPLCHQLVGWQVGVGEKCVLSRSSCVWVFATPWAIALQAPLSMGFSRQEYWSGLPCPPPGDLPNPGIEPGSSALQANSLPSEQPGKPMDYILHQYLGENYSSIQSLSHVWLFVTPWTAARQSSLSITNSWVCSNSCPWSQWCHPTISSSVVPFSSCLQSFPASGSFPVSQFFTPGGQSIGVSASASVLPMNIRDWFPLGWTCWISLQSKGLSRVFSNTPVQKHQFFSTKLSLQSSSHIHTWLLEKS